MLGCSVAHPARHRASDEVVGGLVGEPGDGRLQEAEVDALAAAVRRRAWPVPAADGRQDGDRPEHAGRQVADGDADLGRLTAGRIRLAGDRHQAGRGLDDEVVAGSVGEWAIGAVAADGQVDQARIEAVQLVVGEAKPRQAADAEVLDQDVAPREQPRQHLAASGLLEVEAEAALVAVDGQVVGRLASVGRVRARVTGRIGLARLGGTGEGRSPGARAIAVRRLDLDHVGTEVGQEHRAVRPRQDRRQVADDEARERTPPRHGWRSIVGHDRRPALRLTRRTERLDPDGQALDGIEAEPLVQSERPGQALGVDIQPGRPEAGGACQVQRTRDGRGPDTPATVLLAGSPGGPARPRAAPRRR